ncbi:hypothetical protein TELCIR_08474 [Teladorsagia circumcincta]|uniref:Uncharacterized protein n=1 Tax=Teladorsagia circumcincta TaxID=45464 RepID=A0A2G9UHH4_TELCI|nr:hypothetical protein TELCIR_08474 [Teladorsagia circumcincta]
MASSAEKQARLNSLLNRKRKVETSSQPAANTSAGPSSVPNGNPEEKSEEKMTRAEEEKRKATELILREAKRAKERAEQFGPQGWLRPKSLNTNKQFLHRTLAATLPERKPRRRKTPDE